MAAIHALIFAKYPVAGTVNTRLTPELTPDEAAQLHRASLLAVVERMRRFVELETILVATPDDRLDDFRGMVDVDGIWPQGDGDLGRRLSRAVDRSFDEGAAGVMLLGADSPSLPASIVGSAIETLTSGRAVVGPCDDGGYYMLGLPAPHHELFDRVAWGTGAVFEQTRRRAARIGLELVALPSFYDVDRPDDLRRALADLRAQPEQNGSACDALMALLETFVSR